MTLKFQRKLSYMHMRIEGCLLPGGKAELRSFTSSDYRNKKMPVLHAPIHKLRLSKVMLLKF